MKNTWLVFLLVLCTSCGGGGGGGSSADSLIGANTQLDVEPNSIALGNLTRITVRLSEIHPFGALVIVRFPKQVSYILESSTLAHSGKKQAINPVERESSASEGLRYMTYFVTQSMVEGQSEATLEFILKGTALVEDGSVEVDVNRHNPNKTPQEEFNVAAPRFSADDTRDIEVHS